MSISRNRSRKLRKRSRTIPVKGFGDDAGKYYRCWYCGFVCNVDRDALGDAETGSGEYHIDFAGRSDGSGDSSSPLNTLALMDGHDVVLLELDSTGTPKTIYHEFQPKPSSGCPSCGSKNWRGDYP